MKDIIRIGGKLAIICAIASITLGIANAFTEPIIKATRARQLTEAIDKLSLGFEVGEAVVVDNDSGIIDYYKLTGSKGLAGYIVRVTANGYGGKMIILTSISVDKEILAVKLMENLETPGLGKKAEKSSYMEMFVGTGLDSVIPFRKTQLEPSRAEAITGASITFGAIGKALNVAADFVSTLGGI